MWQANVPQKLVSFTNSKADLERIESERKNGWQIISLVANDGHYVGVIEKTPATDDSNIFLPPRRKIKFLES